MRYLDYTWDLDENGIKFDEELDIDKLGWNEGDWFVVKHVNGRNLLVKIDPLIKFLKEGNNV
jgi:hypothetical protein